MQLHIYSKNVLLAGEQSFGFKI